MAKKKKKKKQNKGNSDSRRKKNKSYLPLILSTLAILISLGQLIFTIPVVLRYFEKVEIKAIEFGIGLTQATNILETSFLIENIGDNTAKNVELELRVLKDSRVTFVPNIFELTSPNVPKTPAQTLFYELDELVPGEKVKLYVHCDFTDYLEINRIDTLIFNKPVPHLKFTYGPHLIKVKHSFGKVKIEYPDSLLLRKRGTYFD